MNATVKRLEKLATRLQKKMTHSEFDTLGDYAISMVDDVNSSTTLDVDKKIKHIRDLVWTCDEDTTHTYLDDMTYDTIQKEIKELIVILLAGDLEAQAKYGVDRIHSGDTVKHFKGNLYEVYHTNAHDIETDKRQVVYRALYGDGKLYVRDYDVFMSEVDKEKYPDAEQEYRFEFYKGVKNHE